MPDHAVGTLPERARRWIEREVGAGTRLRRARRLTGGISSAVHAVLLEDGGGKTQRLVVRRWVGEYRHEGPDNVRREATILDRLSGAGLAAPGLVAADPVGELCGDPALLMSHLDGRLELTPARPDAWLGEMAATAVKIHEMPISAPPFESWLEPENLVVPPWTQRPKLWEAALELVRQEPPDGESRFIHRDFQQFNLLWRRGKISGVVDWVWASRGSPDVDAAHCRLNLAVLYSPEMAEHFRLAYESCAGRTLDPWWDVAGLLVYLPGWGLFVQEQAGSRLEIDFPGMHRRVEQTLEAALHRT